MSNADTVTRKRPLLTIFLIAIAAFTFGPTAAAASTPISSCQTINSPGSYVLLTNLISVSNCILITSDDVVFDGQGHKIDGTDFPYNNYGVYVYKSGTTFTNVTVKNLKVTNWNTGIYYISASNGSIYNNNASSNIYGIYLSGSSNNNNLSNNTANSNTNGIWLSSSSNNTLTSNNVSSNSNVGIYLVSSSNNTLTNNTAKSNGEGIYLLSSSHRNVLTNNTVSSNTNGVYLVSSSNNTMINNSANSNTGSGFFLSSSTNNTLTNNTARSNFLGIRVSASANNKLGNNNASSNGYGIYFESSSNNNTLIGNTANSNTQYGIWLPSSNSNTLTNNTANSNRYGIYLSGSSNNTLTNNTAKSNTQYGIYLDASNNNILSNNTARSNNNIGIYLDASNNNTLTNNTARSNNNDGIYLSSSSNNTLTNNTARSNNNDGIYLSSSSNNTLTNNNAISNNNDGIILSSSSNNTLTINNVSSNSNYGIYLYLSSNNIIYNNLFNNTVNFNFIASNNTWNTTKTLGTNIVGGPYLGGNFWAYPNGTGFSDTCTDSNPLDGICDASYTMATGNIDYLPLAILNYSVSSCTTLLIPGVYTLITDITNSTASTCIQISASDVVLDGAGHNIDGDDAGTDYGVYVYNVAALTNVTVKNLTLSDWFTAINILSTQNSTVQDSNISSNSGGINIDSSTNITITGNRVSGNSGDGVYLNPGTSKTNISNNTFDSNSGSGIYLDSVSGNNITGNTFNGNGEGVHLESALSNTIYNNLFNNTVNVFADATNIWNTTKTPGTNIIGGPNLGGNFWAYPNGTGYSEGCLNPDGDGLCNGSHTLVSGNVDYLPLTNRHTMLYDSLDLTPPSTGGNWHLGETVTVNGSGWTAGESIGIMIRYPNGSDAQYSDGHTATSTGGFESYSIFTLDAGYPTGNYTIWVSIDGGTTLVQHDEFNVLGSVPEFPLGGGLALLAASILYMIACTKNQREKVKLD